MQALYQPGELTLIRWHLWRKGRFLPRTCHDFARRDTDDTKIWRRDIMTIRKGPNFSSSARGNPAAPKSRRLTSSWQQKRKGKMARLNRSWTLAGAASTEVLGTIPILRSNYSGPALPFCPAHSGC